VHPLIAEASQLELPRPEAEGRMASLMKSHLASEPSLRLGPLSGQGAEAAITGHCGRHRRARPDTGIPSCIVSSTSRIFSAVGQGRRRWTDAITSARCPVETGCGPTGSVLAVRSEVPRCARSPSTGMTKIRALNRHKKEPRAF
jgi:hypothetical protein